MRIQTRKSFIAVTLLLILSLFCTGSSVEAASQQEVLSNLSNDYRSGRLDREQYYLYLAQTVLSPESLPPQYSSDESEPMKCGTPVLSEIDREWDTFSPELQSRLSLLFSRPVTQFELVSPEGHFRLHYDTLTGGATPPVPTEDIDSDSIPDFIEYIAFYADSAWRQETSNYGYHPPPSDGTLGGDSLYDIYFGHFQYYGVTSGDAPGPEPWDDYSSHITLHHTFLNFPPNQDPDGDQKGAMKVAIAHEFYHAVQFYYDAFMAPWWIEQTAVWMEDEVYPIVHDNYNYFDHFWPYPQQSLIDTDDVLHMYGAFPWAKFLTQNHGVDFPRDICDSMAKPISSLMSVLQSALQADGSSLYDDYGGFMYWNYMTGSRNDGLHYIDAADYPEIAVLNRHTLLPSTSNWSTAQPFGLGGNYIEATNDSDHVGILTFRIDTTTGGSWGLCYLTSDSTGSYQFSRATPAQLASKKVSLTIQNYQDFVFMPYVKSSTFTGPYGYKYSLYFRPIGDADGSEEIDIDDVVFILSYIFSGGLESDPIEASDADCSGNIDIDDAVYLIAYIFSGGSAPCGEGQQ